MGGTQSAQVYTYENDVTIISGQSNNPHKKVKYGNLDMRKKRKKDNIVFIGDNETKEI